MAKQEEQSNKSLISDPMVGSILTVASGICFLVLGMILPLVGRAAALTPYYGRNKTAFLGVVLLSIVLAGAAIFSKLQRRKIDQSPLPYFSILLLGLSTMLLLAFLMGLLAI